MDALTVSPPLLTPANPTVPKDAKPAKIHAAAEQFEALLLSEMLQSAHPKGGWLGSGEDGASDTANGLAVEQLAQTMAKQGGIGLAKLIANGLERARS